MKEFWHILLGKSDSAEFAAAMFFALLTAAALVMYRVSKRDPSSMRTPYNFSWKFFWQDNLPRIASTVIMIFLTIRVAQYWVKPEWMVYGSIGVGLISDQLAKIFLLAKDVLSNLVQKKITSSGDKPTAFKDDPGTDNNQPKN